MIIKLFIFAFFLMFSACTENSSSSSVVPLDENENMIRVQSSGKSVGLSTDVELEAKFDYDFYIGKHEVTQQDWIDVMGKMGDIDSRSRLIPKTNVSYYDAILYANALSKKEGYDTAYSYSKAIIKDMSYSYCSYLEGLTFDPSKEAYRLPTEAEWIYAASENWNPDNSWNSTNSEYQAHPVCSVGDEDSFCDFAGNAAEWVNDWLVPLKDTVITDYVGGSSPNNQSERIVKGGSYLNAPGNMRLDQRKDVYTVTGSSLAKYIGFRLAFGSIPSPNWLSATGNAEPSVFNIFEEKSFLESALGTYHAKLAFRDDVTGNLAFVSFDEEIPRVQVIKDTLDVYHPDISPDGLMVAFCTKPEGISGKSELYVRDLTKSGLHKVKLDVESAAIPRWMVFDADTFIVYVDRTANNSDSTAWISGSTWRVSFSNGSFGTPEKLFKGTFNGGVSSDLQLAVDGARLLRANNDGVYEIWNEEKQACNVSLEKFEEKRTLFLDFGGSWNGVNYAAHEYALIADDTGKITHAIPAPSSYAFDHTEWTNIENVAVSTLTDNLGAHSRIALMNVENSSVTPLISGEEMWHPCLWAYGRNQLFIHHAGAGELYSEDSIGVYFDEKKTSSIFSMRYKMELFWKYYATMDFAVLGSSRPLSGVVPSMFTEYTMVNLAQTPNDIYISRYLFKNYLLPHATKLKTILVSLDLDFWSKKENADWDYYYADLPGFKYDEDHLFWKDGVPSEMYSYTMYSSGDDASMRNLYASAGGILSAATGGWGETAEVSADSAWYSNDSTLWWKSFDCLKDIVALAQEHGIRVIGAIFPQSPRYKETGAFGRYGLQRSVAPRLISKIKDLETEYPNFTLMDENKMGDHDYPGECSADYDHLSYKGALQFSSRLQSLLQTLSAEDE